MKNIFKILTLFTLLCTLSVGQLWAATPTTVYYAVPSATVGSYTVKLNVNYKGNGDEWQQWDMNLEDYTYDGKLVYSYSFTDKYDGLGCLQFQLYNGESYVSQQQPIGTWTTPGDYNGKIYIHDTGFATFGRDITIYGVPEAMDGSKWDEGSHSLYANFKYGDGEGEWIRQQMTKTSYTYNGNPIYKKTGLFIRYNVIKRVQFLYNDGSDHELYDYTPASQHVSDDIDGKIFIGYVSATHTWIDYATDIALDQQSGSDGSSSVTATVGSAMPAATMPTRTGYTFGGYFTGVDGAGIQYYNADGSSATTWIMDGPTTLYAKWIPVDLTFTAGTNSNWSTAANWSPACVPTIDHNVVIAKPVTVDVTTARAKSVVLDQYNGKTGSLTINAGKELVVAETLRKKNASNAIVATDEDDIVFHSDASNGLGALVMGVHDGTNQATINFYSKSHGVSESEESVAQYLGIPFNTSTVLSAFYNSWVYKILWDAVGNIYWEQITNGTETLRAFKGYCVFASDNEVNPGHYYWMQGTLVPSENKSLKLYWYNEIVTNPNNENLIANSWMAPIKITAFEEEDFAYTDATIYIFNAGSLKDWKKAGGDYEGHYDPEPAIGDATPAPGQYSVYSIKATKYTGNAVIPAMQSFSVYVDCADTTITKPQLTLDYSRLVYDPAIAGTTPSANRAPRRDVEETDPELMRLYVQAESGYSDKLLMLEREDFAQGFENGWDGRKIFGESFAPQLYAMTTDGNMAINCIPDFEGTVLGFKPGDKDTTYTFYFRYEGEETLYLNDLKAQQSTRINGTNTYAFASATDDPEARFIISATPIKPIMTGCENVNVEAASVRKVFINGHICIIRNGRMYDVTGTMVK